MQLNDSISYGTVLMTISERLRADVGGQVFVQRGIWSVQGLHQHATLTRGLRPLLGWDQTRACVCVCVRYDCILAACVPCVMGPWHLLMKKSSRESSRGCKLPCHSRIRSHRSVTLARGRSDMLPSRFLQVIIATEVIQSSYVPVIWTCCFIHIFSFKLSSEAIKSSRTGEVGRR